MTVFLPMDLLLPILHLVILATVQSDRQLFIRADFPPKIMGKQGKTSGL